MTNQGGFAPEGDDPEKQESVSDTAEQFGYESAWDLPSVQSLRHKFDQLKAAGFLLTPEQKEEVANLEGQLADIVNDVDTFYARLGDRNWIFHDMLPTSLLRVNVLAALTPEDAERELMAIYADEKQMRFMIQRMMRLPAMNARQALVWEAWGDFKAGRFGSVVRNLLPVMDGFTNDVDPANRRGLHAREAKDVQSWDTPVGHHRGLTATQKSFTKGFKKLVEGEVFELYRNGILHGMIVNYDNEVIAAKAWNRLFAILDWAASLEKEAEPEKPELTWREVAAQLQDNVRRAKNQEAWSPKSGQVSSPGDYPEHSALDTAATMLGLWERKNWGLLARTFRTKLDKTPYSPGLIRGNFSPYVLEASRITGYRDQAAAITEVDVELVVGGQTFPAVLRMTYEDGAGNVAIHGHEEGEWRLVWDDPLMYCGDLFGVAHYGD